MSSSDSSTRTMWPLVRSVTSQMAGVALAGFFSSMQHDFGIQRIDVHDLHGIADFVFGVLAQRIGYRHFASGDGNAHVNHLFFAADKKDRRCFSCSEP